MDHPKTSGHFSVFLSLVAHVNTLTTVVEPLSDCCIRRQKAWSSTRKGQEGHSPWLSPLGDVWLFRLSDSDFQHPLALAYWIILDSLQRMWTCSTWLIEEAQHLPLLWKLHTPNLSIVLQVPESSIIFHFFNLNATKKHKKNTSKLGNPSTGQSGLVTGNVLASMKVFVPRLKVAPSETGCSTGK